MMKMKIKLCKKLNWFQDENNVYLSPQQILQYIRNIELERDIFFEMLEKTYINVEEKENEGQNTIE